MELECHQPGLSERPSLVVANKIDEAGAIEVYGELKKRVQGVPIYPVCAVLEEGLPELKVGLRLLLDGVQTSRVKLDSIVVDEDMCKLIPAILWFHHSGAIQSYSTVWDYVHSECVRHGWIIDNVVVPAGNVYGLSEEYALLENLHCRVLNRYPAYAKYALCEACFKAL
ncbi:putative GTP-binding protein [Nymphaea thermarum]|nr:putative GTP-binding protein [Nymphaea thermarum]